VTLRIMKCPVCKTYTLKENCPKDRTKTLSVHPPKFSLEKELKYGKYRKALKETALQ